MWCVNSCIVATVANISDVHEVIALLGNARNAVS